MRRAMTSVPDFISKSKLATRVAGHNNTKQYTAMRQSGAQSCMHLKSKLATQ
jgi:hypothetical protein